MNWQFHRTSLYVNIFLRTNSFGPKNKTPIHLYVTQDVIKADHYTQFTVSQNAQTYATTKVQLLPIYYLL